MNIMVCKIFLFYSAIILVISIQNNSVNGATRGYIYVLKETINNQRTGLFKVGRSVDPSDRLSDLQTGNPRKLSFQCNNNFLVNDYVAAEAAAKNALRDAIGKYVSSKTLLTTCYITLHNHNHSHSFI